MTADRRRKWCRSRYLVRVPTKAVCEECRKPFEYFRTGKPRKYCGAFCAHEVRLKQMRFCNEFIRNLERAARL